MGAIQSLCRFRASGLEARGDCAGAAKWFLRAGLLDQAIGCARGAGSEVKAKVLERTSGKIDPARTKRFALDVAYSYIQDAIGIMRWEMNFERGNELSARSVDRINEIFRRACDIILKFEGPIQAATFAVANKAKLDSVVSEKRTKFASVIERLNDKCKKRAENSLNNAKLLSIDLRSHYESQSTIANYLINHGTDNEINLIGSVKDQDLLERIAFEARNGKIRETAIMVLDPDHVVSLYLRYVQAHRDGDGVTALKSAGVKFHMKKLSVLSLLKLARYSVETSGLNYLGPGHERYTRETDTLDAFGGVEEIKRRFDLSIQEGNKVSEAATLLIAIVRLSDVSVGRGGFGEPGPRRKIYQGLSADVEALERLAVKTNEPIDESLIRKLKNSANSVDGSTSQFSKEFLVSALLACDGSDHLATSAY